MLERKGFNPRQLTSARIARGMSMKDLAESAGISRQMISNYESGKTVPKADNLLKITSVLKFPRSFFGVDVPELNAGATFFRSQSAATKKIRDMQKERLKYFFEVYKRLSTYVNLPQVNLPELVEKDVYEITEEEIVEKAMELRKIWGMDIVSPVGHLIRLAEKNGVVIAETTISDKKLDAVSRWIVDRPFIMLTDNDESAVRRRFNVAHELGHLILHNAVESIHDYSSQDLNNIIEKQANLFASHFLLPSEAFAESLLSTSLEYYKDLKRHWKVSIQAMIFKTYALDLINDDQKLYLNKKISWNKWKTKEPYDDEIPVEKPSLMKQVYQMIIENDVIPRNELNNSFRLPVDELEKMIGVRILGTDEGDQAPVLRLIR
ncbi:ImmA/IrrE family metallo-endopeptidase [Listeria booriae]|uniref:ImmA/IrrE family metallo-endopeptidase n=1 Tax=Listeria booriae TaxID=1552123 RepID=A0A7X0XBD4_9LIST|nr:XRE family transcriptional regulator [Listeria booriae]MBC1490994.1 ImmA/IrrE family metallo-endopeptidase [Listeria booriae]MBC1491091.1 ImmA/IrrE family metallo-endopeptidase [Listeria booriae]